MAPEQTYVAHLATMDIQLDKLSMNTDGVLVPAPTAGPSLSLSDLPELDVADGEGPAVHIRLGEMIGAGGMGVVRHAQQMALARQVAVKMLHRAEQPSARMALLREALVTGRLEHPNIVPVYTLGRTADGVPVMMMKRIDGVPWSKVIAQPEVHDQLLDGLDALTFHLGVLQTVCNAVHYAHSHGVLHRDLKPENVMIGSFGEVYLLDWGLAVLTRPVEGLPLALAANVRSVAGTPGYMAPEMAAAANIGVHSDVYLLGAILHEVLTGQRRHTADTLEALLESSWVSAPAQFPAGVPAELAQLCNQTCDASPTNRPASAEALRRAIGTYLLHRGAAAMVDQAVSRLDALPDAKAGEDRDRLLVEAQYGIEQALREWPDNAPALAAQTRLTVILDQRAAELAHLEHLRKEADTSVGAGARVRSLAMAAIFGVGTSFGAAGAEALGWMQPHHRWWLITGALIIFWGIATYGLVVLLNRRQHSEASANMLRGMMLSTLALTLHWGLCAWLGVAFSSAFALSLVPVAMATGMMALLQDPRSFPAAAMWAATAVAIAIFPDQVFVLSGIGSGLSWGWILVLWSRDGS